VLLITQMDRGIDSKLAELGVQAEGADLSPAEVSTSTWFHNAVKQASRAQGEVSNHDECLLELTSTIRE
jgi:hypothetical protein